MPSYTLREPHPTIPRDSYVHSGRGGAGNIFRAPTTTSPAGMASVYPPAATLPSASTRPAPTARQQSSTSTSGSRSFHTGRGGAGNAHAAVEPRAVLCFDEEYARAETRERRQSAGHVGRGGAGNVYSGSSSSNSGTAAAAAAPAAARKERKQSSASRRDSDATMSSNGSDAGSVRSAGFWGRISGASLHH